MVNSTAFAELGHVTAGSAIAKASGASQGIGSLIALKSGRSRRGCLELCRQANRRKLRMKSTTSKELPSVYLARHGETAWSLTGQHTGLTDLPLTERGEQNARALGERLAGLNFGKVFMSPLKRAVRTCELAGFGSVAEVDRDLLEWNYGQYEGRRTAEILAERPEWQLFRDGCPGGESPDLVAARADCVLSRVRALRTDVLLFSSGHFLRVLRPAG